MTHALNQQPATTIGFLYSRKLTMLSLLLCYIATGAIAGLAILIESHERRVTFAQQMLIRYDNGNPFPPLFQTHGL